MRAFFRHIRTQPKHIRDRYAFSIAATFTGLVVLVWVIARPETPPTFIAATASSTEPTAFATLLKNSKEQLAGLRAALSSSTAATESGDTATTTPQDPKAIVLTPEEIAAASEKAASNTPAVESEPLQYTEVLIGTTSASTTVSASSTAQ